MMAMMASAVGLGLSHGGSWWLLAWAQLAGYAFAVLGLFSAIRERVKLAATAAHFVSMNAALFLGFFRWLRRSQQVTWHRTSRAASAT
jgi:hypothetical protein